MAETNMVELVIKMPEDVFKRTVFYREFRDLNDSITTIKALEKAVLLPKEHGRLKDVDWIFDNCPDYHTEDLARCFEWSDIDEAPTIIEDRYNYENKEDIEL